MRKQQTCIPIGKSIVWGNGSSVSFPRNTEAQSKAQLIARRFSDASQNAGMGASWRNNLKLSKSHSANSLVTISMGEWIWAQSHDHHGIQNEPQCTVTVPLPSSQFVIYHRLRIGSAIQQICSRPARRWSSSSSSADSCLSGLLGGLAGRQPGSKKNYHRRKIDSIMKFTIKLN